jgi:hypothetical protein
MSKADNEIINQPKSIRKAENGVMKGEEMATMKASKKTCVALCHARIRVRPSWRAIATITRALRARASRAARGAWRAARALAGASA